MTKRKGKIGEKNIIEEVSQYNGRQKGKTG